jgi:hypothetical protein
MGILSLWQSPEGDYQWKKIGPYTDVFINNGVREGVPALLCRCFFQ